MGDARPGMGPSPLPGLTDQRGRAMAWKSQTRVLTLALLPMRRGLPATARYTAGIRCSRASDTPQA